MTLDTLVKKICFQLCWNIFYLQCPCTNKSSCQTGESLVVLSKLSGIYENHGMNTQHWGNLLFVFLWGLWEREGKNATKLDHWQVLYYCLWERKVHKESKTGDFWHKMLQKLSPLKRSIYRTVYFCRRRREMKKRAIDKKYGKVMLWNVEEIPEENTDSSRIRGIMLICPSLTCNELHSTCDFILRTDFTGLVRKWPSWLVKLTTISLIFLCLNQCLLLQGQQASVSSSILQPP